MLFRFGTDGGRPHYALACRWADSGRELPNALSGVQSKKERKIGRKKGSLERLPFFIQPSPCLKCARPAHLPICKWFPKRGFLRLSANGTRIEANTPCGGQGLFSKALGVSSKAPAGWRFFWNTSAILLYLNVKREHVDIWLIVGKRSIGVVKLFVNH